MVFPAVDGDVGQLRQHLRQHGVGDDLQPAGPCGGGRLQRLGVDMLDGLGEELAHHAGGVQCQSQHAGQGAEAHGRHEQDAQDDLGHRAEGRQHGAGHLTDARVRRGVGRRQQRQRQRQQHRQQRPGHRHRQRVAQRDQPALPTCKVGRHHLRAQLRQRRQAVGKALGVEEARDLQGQQRHGQHGTHQGPAALALRRVGRDERVERCRVVHRRDAHFMLPRSSLSTVAVSRSTS